MAPALTWLSASPPPPDPFTAPNHSFSLPTSYPSLAWALALFFLYACFYYMFHKYSDLQIFYNLWNWGLKFHWIQDFKNLYQRKIYFALKLTSVIHLGFYLKMKTIFLKGLVKIQINYFIRLYTFISALLKVFHLKLLNS